MKLFDWIVMDGKSQSFDDIFEPFGIILLNQPWPTTINNKLMTSIDDNSPFSLPK